MMETLKSHVKFHIFNEYYRMILVVLTVSLFLFLITCIHSWNRGLPSSEASLHRQLSDRNDTMLKMQFLVSIISLSLVETAGIGLSQL